MSESVYITTPIYYVNDVPHLGHAYTTVAADALARWHRSCGRRVRFVTGTDEHGQKIERAAAAHGEAPIELADRVVARFRALWEQLHIAHDDFIRTTEPRHQSVVRRLWSLMADEGDIERLESAGAHVHPVPHDAGGLDLQQVLEVSWEAGIESILCEGGASLAEALLREGRVQRLYLLIAPTTLGTGGVSAFPRDAKAVEWSAFSPACAPQMFGRDTLIVLDKEGD